MKFFVVDDLKYTSAENCAQYIVDNISEDEYDEMLDDCYGEIKIGSLSYSPSIALYRIDPIAYNCGFSDYTDSCYSNIVYELERMDGGDTESFHGFDVECVDNESAEA